MNRSEVIDLIHKSLHGETTEQEARKLANLIISTPGMAPAVPGGIRKA